MTDGHSRRPNGSISAGNVHVKSLFHSGSSKPGLDFNSLLGQGVMVHKMADYRHAAVSPKYINLATEIWSAVPLPLYLHFFERRFESSATPPPPPADGGGVRRAPRVDAPPGGGGGADARGTRQGRPGPGRTQAPFGPNRVRSLR